MAAQRYFDFAGPAKALGATQNARGWHFKGARYYHAADVLLENGIEPAPVAPPKTRTFAAIRRQYSTPAAARTPSDKDWQAMRAFRYLQAMAGLETPHSGNDDLRYKAARYARFEKAPDGSRRVAAIELDDGWREIPHWDFVPSIVETTLPERVAA